MHFHWKEDEMFDKVDSGLDRVADCFGWLSFTVYILLGISKWLTEMWFSLYLRGLCFYGLSWSALHRPWPSHLSLQHLASDRMERVKKIIILTEYLKWFCTGNQSWKWSQSLLLQITFTARVCRFNWCGGDI